MYFVGYDAFHALWDLHQQNNLISFRNEIVVPVCYCFLAYLEHIVISSICNLRLDEMDKHIYSSSMLYLSYADFCF